MPDPATSDRPASPAGGALASALVNPRLAGLGDYPFGRLRQLLADETPAAGRPTLDLALGEPQHSPPAIVADILARQPQGWRRYPPLGGSEALNAAIALWLTRRFGLADRLVAPHRNTLPVSGTREALFLLALLTVPETRAGGRPVVLVPNPYYATYSGAAVMSGAEPVFMPSPREAGFLPDLDTLDEATLARTALMYLCSPSNPQGAAASRAYLERAIGLARRHGFVLAVDECYSEIYTGEPPAGALEACGDALDNLIVLHSLSKRSSAPGLRSGFVAGDATLIEAFRWLRGYAATTMPIPIQAASAALWLDEHHVEANRALYREKFELADRILGDRFGYVRPAGGFFLWLDVGDGEAAARALWREAGLRTLPGAYLSAPEADGRNPAARYLRVALVHDAATLHEALPRLVEVLDRLEGSGAATFRSAAAATGATA